MTYTEAPIADTSPRGEKTPNRVERDDFSLAEAVAERSELQNQLYVRYRRPLLQVFHYRRIHRDAADDLLQRTFLQAIRKSAPKDSTIRTISEAICIARHASSRQLTGVESFRGIANTIASCCPTSRTTTP